MAAVKFCTVADLALAAGEISVVRISMDEGNTTMLIGDSDVQDRCNRYIESSASQMRGLLAGHVDNLDAAPAGSQLAADLRDLNVALTLAELYRLRGHTTYGSNKWLRAADNALARIKDTRRGEIKIGDDPQPQRLAWSSTQDDSPTYGKSATGGGGEDGDVLASF